MLSQLISCQERVMEMVIKGVRSQAKIPGNSLAQLPMILRLSQSGLADADQAAVLETTVTSGELPEPVAYGDEWECPHTLF